ncbi:MAG: peptidylprolyl isomerase [Phycisphaerales bacterium]|nr:MAG: peptidylprolyl isomerase [Phycisphaerales bacterium]
MTLIVNGERIQETEIQQEMERLRPRYEEVFADQAAEEREAQLADWSRENVIERVLLRQEARQNGPDIPAAEIDAALAKLKEQYDTPKALHEALGLDSDEKIKEAIELQMKTERTISRIHAAAPEPSEEEARQHYEENKEQFKSDEQIRVAHIVKYVNWQTDEATAVQMIGQAHEEIANGAPFEVVVDKYTDCGDSGGDLGYVMRGQMVEEFEDVVFNLSPGQVSDVFRTRFGFHVAKVYDRRPPTIPEFKDVKKRIVETLREQKQEEALGDHLDALKSQAVIEDA